MSPTNGSVAPVCPISRSQAAPGMPGSRTPSVPQATDLPSAIAALNQINLILQQFLLPAPVINNVYPTPPVSAGGGSSAGQDGGSGSTKLMPQRWAQGGREVYLVRIHDPLDITNWVDLRRIQSQTWTDAEVSGHFITWNLGLAGAVV